MNIGVIGTGNMGTILIRALIDSQAVDASKLTIMNRTTAKAEKIKAQYPAVNVAESPEEVASVSDIIFICVKPHDIHPLLADIKEQLPQEKLLVSITSPVSVEQLASAVDAQTARMIPSITNRALHGISLLTFGETTTEQNRELLVDMCSKFSHPTMIEEDITRVASDIVSCGPAFISYLLQRMINAAVSETEITKEKATELTSQMMIGFGKLLEKEIFTLETLQEKVCVKGGITGEGISVLESELGDVFEHLFIRTHEKYAEDKAKSKEQFGL